MEKIEKEIETYAELKVKWKQICKMSDERISQTIIAKVVGKSEATVSFVLKLYEQTGKIPMPLKRGRKVGEKKLLSLEQEKEIKDLIIDKSPDQLKFECFLWTANTVRELIKQRYGIELGKQTMVEYLQNWGMSCQRPIKRAAKKKPQETEAFKKEVYPKFKRLANSQNAEIFFADETGINNQAYNPMGYAPKNCPPVVPFETHRETVNMLSAVSPSGEHKFMLYREKTTQQTLIEFTRRLIKEKKKDKIFIFLDNLKVHHGKLFKEFIERNKNTISVFYFPSYSPEINPQEYLNNILKQNIHSGMPPKNQKEIENKTNNFMQNVTPEKIKKIFEHPNLNYQKDPK